MNRLINHAPVARLRRPVLLLLATLLSTLVLACNAPRSEQHAQRYDLKGKVVSVDKSQQEVVIAHEQIPDYMEAMTMSFPLKERDALDVVGAGDQIQATLVVANGGYWLENPVITKAIPKDANSAAAVTAVEPEEGTEVPDFTLVNQDGRRIRLRQYRDRALVITFIYTRCPMPDYCTLMSTNFAEINRALEKEPAFSQKTHLLSVSIDPEYDTPKVLKSYGAAHTEKYTDEKFEQWEFATGEAEEIKKMAGFFGLTYNPENNEIVHSLRTAIVAPGGRLHKLYRGNEWKPSDIIGELRKLSGARASE